MTDLVLPAGPDLARRVGSPETAEGWITQRSATDVSPPRFAVAFLGVTIVALPVLVPTLPGNAAIVDIAALMAIASCMLWAASARATIHVPYGVPVGILVLSGALATMLSPFPGAGLQALFQDLFLLGWAAAVATVVRTPEAFVFVARMWSWSATGWATVMVLATLVGQTGVAGIQANEGSRAALTFGDQNGAAVYFAISLVVILAFQIPRHRALRSGAITLVVIALVLTGSLAGILSISACIFVLTIVSTWRRYGLPAAIAIALMLAIFGAALLALANAPRLADEASASRFALIRDSLGRGRQSSAYRATLARETLDLIQTGPLIGRGPGATRASLEALQSPYPEESHDDLAAALVERGIGGFLGALFLFCAVGWRLLSVATGRPAPAFTRVIPSPHVLLAALPILIVFALTHEILHDRAIWTFFGLVAAVHLWAGAPRVPTRSSA
jgi:O-antigen ligase